MIRAVAFVGGLLLAASFAHAAPASDAIDHILVPVSRLDRAVAFYTGALHGRVGLVDVGDDDRQMLKPEVVAARVLRNGAAGALDKFDLLRAEVEYEPGGCFGVAGDKRKRAGIEGDSAVEP